MIEVQARQYDTCIYGRNSASSLSVKQLENEIKDPYVPGFFSGHRICHHSEKAVCRGFWNRHKNDFALGQIAQRLETALGKKLIAFVDHD
jgi:hypothetical protein